MQFDMMTLFDILLLIFGSYMIFAALRMKKSGKISTLIVPASEIERIRDKEGFITEIYGKMMLFAAVIACYGLFGTLTDLIEGIPGVPIGNLIGILIFFVVMFWFFKSLSKAKGKYMI